MTTGQTLKTIADQNKEIVKLGQYELDGQVVSIRQSIESSCNDTETYLPGPIETLLWPEAWAMSRPLYNTVIDITPEKSLTAAARLVNDTPPVDDSSIPCVLNFANPVHPGGGYLGGARAQEEDLCRCSGLFATLDSKNAYPYYVSHAGLTEDLYSTHAAVYSPRVPVFRDDQYALLPQPFHVDFVTSAAPIALPFGEEEKANPYRVGLIIQERILRILALASQRRKRTLVLGAWGCGAFENNPHVVAAAFANYLKPLGPFHGRFEKIVFAVYDPQPGTPNFKAFKRAFPNATTPPTSQP